MANTPLAEPFFITPAYEQALDVALDNFLPREFVRAALGAFQVRARMPLEESYRRANDNARFAGPFSRYKAAGVVGIDLPLLLRGNVEGPVVAIVGRDPQRHIKRVRPLAQILVGTPYALHNPNTYETLTRVYFDVISEVQQLCSVYLTDAYKVYGCCRNGARMKPSRTERAGFRRILGRELSYIKPDIVLAFGNEAYSELSRSYDGCPVRKIPHPSNSNREFNRIPDARTRAGKTRYIVELVNRTLMSLRCG